MTTAREAPILVRPGAEAERARARVLVAPSTARGRTSLAMLHEGRGLFWVAVCHDADADTVPGPAGLDASDAAGPIGDDAADAGCAERLVGILLADLQPDPETGEPVGYIQELLVHPAYRRRGVAMHLLDAAERHFLGDQRCAGMMLITTPENDAALRLYRSRGYGVDQVRLRKPRPDDHG
ncbi:MAG TPA: N-acetyltransferase [Ktedonobacterales bacterium]|jgi:ribosomal protein S18 acetylase RimI-like enzyme